MSKPDFENIIKGLIGRWGKSRNINTDVLEWQIKVAETIWDRGFSIGGSLIIIKAPTGIGKTEAFVAPFLAQWSTNEWFAPRMFIVEPVHALLRQMRDRIEKYASSFGIGHFVNEDHGEVTVPTYLYTSPITLTTIDSFAYGYLAKRIESWVEHGITTGRYSLPVGVETTAYVVLDETHLMQDEAFLGPRVLSKIICSLVHAGSIVVFSSATLPTKIVSLFKMECGGEYVIETPTPPEVNRNITVRYRQDEKLIDKSDGEFEVNENVIDEICEGVSRDSSEPILIILNTVERTRVFFRELRNRCSKRNVEILHSLMKRGDREAVLGRISGNVVLVGTQTVEVGLDYDFTKLYTELSPIDSLIQRIGRIGRRGSRSEVYIFDPISSNPYPTLSINGNDVSLVDLTKNVLASLNGILNGTQLQLGNAEYVQQLVDEVYSDNVIDALSRKGDGLYLRVIEYMNNLHLLAYPPEHPGDRLTDVTIRPSFYVTLYLLNHDDLKNVNGSLDNNRETLTIGKIDALKQYLMRISISLLKEQDTNWRRLISVLNHAGNNGELYVLSGISNNSLLVFKQIKQERQESIADNVRPGDTYLVLCRDCNEYYDEAGLRVEEFDRPIQQVGRKSRRRGRGRS